MNRDLLIGLCLFFVLHIVIWFANSLQFINEWWKEHPIVNVMLFAMPIGFLSLFAMRHTYYGLGDTLWGTRFVAFGTSYLVFPFLTYWFLKESMLNPKTVVCFLLSLLIVLLQVFWTPTPPP